jgi:hypothetical protein
LPEKKRPFWERHRSELRPIVFGLALAGLLIAAQKALKQWTDFGRQLDQTGERLLQAKLINSNGWRRAQVTIVDISSMGPSSPASASKNVAFTDRLELQKFVDQVASADPMAIGIDVIFDPAPDGTASVQDYKFLNHCLELLQRPKPIPVRVGIYSTVGLGPERWLGDPRFKTMGTSIIVPFDDRTSAPTGRMIQQFHFQLNNHDVTVDSLSYSLAMIALDEAARAYTGSSADHRKIGYGIRRLLGWLIEDPHKIQHGTVNADAFTIDFGLVQDLKKKCIPADDLKVRYKELANKIVLIGRATQGAAPDAFTTTAPEGPLPGVYIHAAAVDTILEAQLFKLSVVGSILIDIFLALFMLLFERLVEHLLGSVSHDKLRRSLEVLMPALLAVAVLRIGVFWVDHTGIYWTDFVLVAFVLLFHKPVEAGFQIVRESLQQSPRFLGRKS